MWQYLGALKICEEKHVVLLFWLLNGYVTLGKFLHNVKSAEIRTAILFFFAVLSVVLGSPLHYCWWILRSSVVSAGEEELICLKNMSYRRERSIREIYEERILGRPQAPYQRAGNVMDRRPPFNRQEEDYERGSDYEYGRGRGGYHGDDQRGFHGDRAIYSGERRCAPLHRREDPYPYYRGPAEDPPAPRHLDLRGSGRGTSQPNHRGQKLPPPRSVSVISHRGDDGAVHGLTNSDQGDEREGLKRKAPFPPAREHSPVKREVTSYHHTRSSCSFSPDSGKTNCSHPSQPKKTALHQDFSEKERPPSYHAVESQDGSPHSSVSATKDEAPGLEAEQSEEVKMKEDPAQTTEARRAHAISNKALEIEKLYRQDCETFGMVVKMLISKQPALESQLQAALKENLVEIKERCLEDLRHFISEVNMVLKADQSSRSGSTWTTDK